MFLSHSHIIIFSVEKDIFWAPDASFGTKLKVLRKCQIANISRNVILKNPKNPIFLCKKIDNKNVVVFITFAPNNILVLKNAYFGQKGTQRSQ